MTQPPPEHNATGIDYADRRHLHYAGPIIDFHAHVMITRPGDPMNGPPPGHGPGASLTQAECMLDVGSEFGIARTVTMCPVDDIEPLRERFGDQLVFNAMINKKTPIGFDPVIRLLVRSGCAFSLRTTASQQAKPVLFVMRRNAFVSSIPRFRLNR